MYADSIWNTNYGEQGNPQSQQLIRTSTWKIQLQQSETDNLK